MKNLTRVFTCSMMGCGLLVMFSCKKQLAETIADQSIAYEQAASANECKPAVLGVFSFYPGWEANGEWLTLAQKWYENGKVKYLKAKHGGWTGTIIDPIHELMFELNWGEVTYVGNQVYLNDVESNRMQMRVTLDNQGRPVASYYHYEPYPGSYIYDTTYYYYDGERLDNLISLYNYRPYGPNSFNEWRKYVFSYDAFGNVTKAEFAGRTRLNVQYDYTKPVSDISGNFHVTSSLKLLEYMELIKLPMHYAVIRTNLEYFTDPYRPEQFYEYSHAEYKDYIISDGMVKSYVYYDPYRIVTFYNGWDCNTGTSMNLNNRPEDVVGNLKQFQQLYSDAVIGQ
jgi:hypothetical protein